MSLSKPTVFTGAATALITPFQNGEIDYPALSLLIERQIRGGIRALLVAGTTGEGATLSEKEHRELISFAAEKIGGRVPLIAGCGSNNTETAVRLARNATEAGADALLAVTPYYNKASERGIVAHYRAVSDAVTTPLIVYNVPSRTGLSVPLPLYRELAKIETVVGVKEASGDLSYLASLVGEFGSTLDVWTGCDSDCVFAGKLGAVGCISVYSNLFPSVMGEICRNDSKKSYDLLRANLTRIRAMFREVNPIPVKYVSFLRGLCAEEYRLPLTPPSSETATYLQNLFQTPD